GGSLLAVAVVLRQPGGDQRRQGPVGIGAAQATLDGASCARLTTASRLVGEMALATMPHYICTTCGTQYAESQSAPATCAICDEPRQYVKVTGQQWTTLDRIRLTNRTSIKFKEPGLLGIGIEPHFGIGQRALFLRSPGGNI